MEGMIFESRISTGNKKSPDNAGDFFIQALVYGVGVAVTATAEPTYKTKLFGETSAA